jgi:hypothetical protein
VLDSVPQFHQLFAFRLTFQGLDFLDDFFKERNHVIADKANDGVLIETEFFLFFTKGVGDFDEKGHGGEFLHELEGFFEYFFMHGVLEVHDFLEECKVAFKVWLDFLGLFFGLLKLEFMGREEGFLIMKEVELDFGYGLFVPDVLEVLGELLFAFEELVVNDGVDVLEIVHFFYNWYVNG